MSMEQLMNMLRRDNAPSSYEQLERESKILRKNKDPRLVEVLGQLVHFFLENNGLSIAMKYQNELAQIAEKAEQWEKAQDYWLAAADNAETENALSSQSGYLFNVVRMELQLDRFTEAITHLDTIISIAKDNNLLKYSIVKYCCLISLCEMADSTIPIESIRKMPYPELVTHSNRESKLVENLLKAIEENNADNYLKEFNDYQKALSADKYLVDIINKIYSQRF